MSGNTELTLLLLGASVCLGFVFVTGYSRTRDPLHPVVFLAPLFFLGLVLDPIRVLLHPDIQMFFPDFEGLGFALGVQYLGMAAFFIGILSVRGLRLPPRVSQSLFDPFLTTVERQRLRSLAWIIATVVLLCYWIGIWNAGGFVEAYSRHKGGFRAVSGYQGEAVNLGLAAVVIYALGCQGRRLRLTDAVTGLVMVSPILFGGTFGGRRGPLFVALTGLFLAYWIAKGRLPRPRVIIISFSLFVVSLVFLQSQRNHLYLGSGQGVKWEAFTNSLYGEELSSGNNCICSSGAVIAVSRSGDWHYGRRAIMTYLVRPIPKQIWPTKYDDMAAMLYGEGETYRSVVGRASKWDKLLGWSPPQGSAVNAIVYMFTEFSWAYVLPMAALGRMIGFLWFKFRTDGGIWFVLYVIVAALSIYLPTQSFRAFAYRFLYITLMTLVFWRFFFGGISARRPRRVPVRGRYPSAAPRPMS